MNKIDYKEYHRDSDYNKMESTFKNIFQSRYNLISKYLLSKTTKKVLDIGCSNGIFLDILKERGFETWGVEPSTTAIKAKSKDHKIVNNTIEKVNLPLGYFDLIIVNHTLEHLEKPKLVLLKINKLLKNDGLLFIDVPNVGSLSSILLGKYWPYLLPKEHLWQFDKKSILSLVESTGFEVLSWKSRSGIFEYNNPLLELKRKRFLVDVISFPYALLATFLNMGDSMSVIAKKK